MFITDWAGGFQDANAACAREAGDSESHVVAFRSQLEWDSWMDASMLAAVRRSWVWLSYTDASIEGDWVGGDGYPMPSFAEWDVGEPDDLFNEDCSHLWAIRGYLAINDIGCYGVLPALCRTGPPPPLFSSGGFDFDVAMAASAFTPALQLCAQVFGETATPAWFSTAEQFAGLGSVLHQRDLPSRLWTGYNDAQAGGSWTYETHALPPFISWAAGEPAASHGQCAELTALAGSNSSYVLATAACATPNPVLCRHGGGYPPILVDDVVFELVPSLLTFAEAVDLCTEFDQHLAWFDTLAQYNAVVTALAATDGVITSGGLGQSVWVGYADHGDLTAHWVAEAYPNRSLPAFVDIGDSFRNDGDCALMAMPVGTTRVAIDQYDCSFVSHVLCRQIPEPNWQPVVSGARTFTVSQNKTNWNDAEDACVSEVGAGAQLATFLTHQEWVDVLAALGATAHEAFGLWVGYTLHREGSWQNYVTSYPMLPFVQWLPGSPQSESDFGCAEVRRRGSSVSLNNRDCASRALMLPSLCVQGGSSSSGGGGGAPAPIYTTVVSRRPDGSGGVYTGGAGGGNVNGGGGGNGGTGGGGGGGGGGGPLAVSPTAVYNYDVPYGIWTSWAQAVDVCIMEFGPAASLAWFETAQQFADVAARLKSLAILRAGGGSSGGGGGGVWIGYTHTNATGAAVSPSAWVSRATGAPMPSFLPWEAGEPAAASTGGGRDCSQLVLSAVDDSSPVVNDVACDTLEMPALCMWTAAPKPPLVGYGGWTYFLTSGAMTWQEARAEVEIVPGATLATFDSESDMVAVFHLVHRANWIAVGLDQGLWIGYLDDSNGTQPSGTAGDPGVPIGHFTPWTSGATVGPDNCARLVFEPAQASNPINLFTTECQPPAGVSFFGLGQMPSLASDAPSRSPTRGTTASPTTASPTSHPITASPTTVAPSSSPTTRSPTSSPTSSPTDETPSPTTVSPTSAPTETTTGSPTASPTTHSPTTKSPTTSPTASPSTSPTTVWLYVNVNDANYTTVVDLNQVGFVLDVGNHFPHNDLFGTNDRTEVQSVTQLTILPASTKEEGAHNCEAKGLSIASFSTHDFETEQGVVADAVVAAVGYDQPVMTGVMSDLGHCMSVTAMDNGHNLWAETDCAQTELPCMCREGGPPSQQQAFVATRTYGAQPASAGAGALPALLLAGCVMALLTVLTSRYRSRKTVEVALEELELAPLTGFNNSALKRGIVRSDLFSRV